VLVVDTSVWVNFLRANPTRAVQTLRNAITLEEFPVLVGDIVLLEVLQGARDDNHAARIESDLRQFPIVPMLGDAVALAAARNFRRLRALGITLRSTVDLIIGSFCLLHGHALLHEDRDYEPMVNHLGLIVA
jgi:predicted nucleic acid-binding protein